MTWEIGIQEFELGTIVLSYQAPRESIPMIDNRYDEHPDYDSTKLLADHEVGTTIPMMGHLFTYLGLKSAGSEKYGYLSKTYSVHYEDDASGDWDQIVEIIEEFSTNVGNDSEIESAHLRNWVEVGTMIPIDAESPNLKVEKTLNESVWGNTDPHGHTHRIGGYPSFGESEDYGQPYAPDAEGNLTPIPFLGQYILPDNRYIHAYSINGLDEFEGYEEFDTPYEENLGAFAIVQGEPVEAGIILKKDEGRVVLSETAYATEDGEYPKFAFYFQGSESTEEYPHTIFRFPGADPYDGNIPPNMAVYAETFLLWDGKSKARLVEQYD